MGTWFVAMALAGALVGSGVRALDLAQSNTDTRTVWDGVYSVDQAQRGKQQYAGACAACHKEDLSGDGITPGLADDGFIERWDKDTVEGLFTRIKTTMPADNPGKLADAEYLDVVAFLLKANGFPGGPTDLAREGTDSLKNILIVRVKK